MAAPPPAAQTDGELVRGSDQIPALPARVLRQLLLGAAAAGVTYLIGHLASTTASSHALAEVSPTTAGSPATASSPAARATALFTPLATPAWRTR